MKKRAFKLFSILVILSVVVLSTVLAKPVSARYRAAITTSVDAHTKSGIPGSVVSYVITLTNADGAGASLSLTGSMVGDWPDPTIIPSTVNFSADGDQNVIVNVPVPTSATAGQFDVTVINFNTCSPSSCPASITFTTTASSPAVTGRPLLGVRSYNAGAKPVVAGSEFNLAFALENRGGISALNVVVTFEGTGFYPRITGGVQSIGNIDPNGVITFTQPFLAGSELAWQDTGTIKASVIYTDPSGQSFSEVFTLTINLTSPYYYSSATATPKATLKPQLVITGYKTDVDPLQPGSLFELKLDVKNLGSADARNITMVLGGGVAPGSDSGTPQAGGVSGSSGDLTNFAPIGSSNLLFVGNIEQEMIVTVSQNLVVNVTTQPGAYTLKISFVYDDPKGTRFGDDQVITLLVY
jgi:hypothetical protein